MTDQKRHGLMISRQKLKKNQEILPDKQKERQEIEVAVQRFLADGKKITRLPDDRRPVSSQSITVNHSLLSIVDEIVLNDWISSSHNK